MSQTGLFKVNFVFSSAAKVAAESLRREYDLRFADDPAAVLAVAWGYVDGSDPSDGRPVLTFYPRSMLADVEDAVQEISGVKFVYFTTGAFHPFFAGKVLDYSRTQGFFLRAP